jgi:hypothetical protein
MPLFIPKGQRRCAKAIPHGAVVRTGFVGMVCRRELDTRVARKCRRTLVRKEGRETWLKGACLDAPVKRESRREVVRRMTVVW